MARGRRSGVPKWKQAVAIACLAYAAVVWALPVFMLPFVNILPFVHERTVIERLPVSIAGSVLFVLALIAMNGGRIPPKPNFFSRKRERVIHWLGVSAGLAMFTYVGAALSANTLGIVAKVLPGDVFEAVVVLRATDYSGSRYKSVWLEYKEPESGEMQHLILSKRLFEYPELKPGDTVQLRGERTMIGIYINGFSLAKTGLTSNSSGSPTATVQLRR